MIFKKLTGIASLVYATRNQTENLNEKKNRTKNKPMNMIIPVQCSDQLHHASICSYTWQRADKILSSPVVERHDKGVLGVCSVTRCSPKPAACSITK